MSLLNNKEILTELTAIRLGLQFYLDHMFEQTPRLIDLASDMRDDPESYGYDVDVEVANTRSAGHPFLNHLREHGKPPTVKQPYQPTDIITPDYEQQVDQLERDEQGDDTELMIKQAFRNEFGFFAMQALENKTEPAVGLYETFRQNWYYQQSKLGGCGVVKVYG